MAVTPQEPKDSNDALDDASHRKAIRSERRFFVMMSTLCVIGLVVLLLGHPSSYSMMPKCPFYIATGLYCPGCGSLRATHYLLRGNVSQSLRNHPLMIPLLVCILFFYGKRLYEFRKGRNVIFKGELTLVTVILAVFVIFFIVRNIPYPVLDWTRPPAPTAVKKEFSVVSPMVVFSGQK